MEKGKVFTSEAVSEGHPDKVCDQISDAILSECLKVDKNAHVACEVMIGESKVVIGGEITMDGTVDYEGVAKAVLKEIGYNSSEDGFDSDNANYEILIKEQSSARCKSNCVTISPLGTFIRAVEFVKGSSTKITPPACSPTPQINPSIRNATSQSSGKAFISLTNKATGSNPSSLSP